MYTPCKNLSEAAKHILLEDEGEMNDFVRNNEDGQEARKAHEERSHEFQSRKGNKAKTIAKTAVTLDVKPWDEETSMDELEMNVRNIEKDGLLWKQSQLVAIGFGVRKLRINCVVEDEKVSVDELQAEIEEAEDHVQSTDIVAMQKL